MAYNATVLEVMIASPSDVSDERKIVRNAIADWNAVYARERAIMLHPVGWETHSSPELAGRAQQIINERLLAHADILVGIFWTRVGTPTGKAISGSIEEIEEHLRQQKPVMLYFSNVPVMMDSVDAEQYRLLADFKKWAQGRGLVESFHSREDFKDKFQRQLPLALRDNMYLQRVLPQPSNTAAPSATAFRQPSRNSISDDARALLAAAIEEPNGTVLVARHLGGTTIQAGNKSFGEDGSRRTIARWEGAIQELVALAFLRDANGRGEFYEVTDAGYRFMGS